MLLPTLNSQVIYYDDAEGARDANGDALAAHARAATVTATAAQVPTLGPGAVYLVVHQHTHAEYLARPIAFSARPEPGCWTWPDAAPVADVLETPTTSLAKRADSKPGAVAAVLDAAPAPLAQANPQPLPLV